MHDSSFISSSASVSPLPLTRENLLCLEQQPTKDSVTNEILARYCQEIVSLNDSRQQRQQQQRQQMTPSYRERCQSTPPPHKDIVVASPRILPFPYHNDSMFLPTAEQIQYQHQHSAVSSFTSSGTTSRADSSSLAAADSFCISRPHSINHIDSSPSSSIINQHPERRSLPARLDYSNNIVISSATKKQQQQRFLRRSSSFRSSSVTTASPTSVQQQQAPQQQQKGDNNSHKKKPWLKRILNFFNKNKQRKQQQQTSSEEGTVGNSIDQVWYCQYSKNPSTRFEKYYHHQHQHQQQMISVS